MSETSVLHLQSPALFFSQLPFYRKIWAQCSNHDYANTAGLALRTTCRLCLSPLHQSRKCITLPELGTTECPASAFSFFTGNIVPYSLLSFFVQVIIAAYGQKLGHLLIWNSSLRYFFLICRDLFSCKVNRSFHVGEIGEIKHATPARILLKLSTKYSILI